MWVSNIIAAADEVEDVGAEVVVEVVVIVATVALAIVVVVTVTDVVAAVEEDAADPRLVLVLPRLDRGTGTVNSNRCRLRPLLPLIDVVDIIVGVRLLDRDIEALRPTAVDTDIVTTTRALVRET